MLKSERREEKRTRAVAKTRRKSNIKSIWLLIRARQKREAAVQRRPPGH